MAPSTHPSLLSRVRDPTATDAWREFDARYADLILRYARARGLQTDAAEDVRQAVMLRLFRHLPSFQYRPELGRFRDYLGRVVRNEVWRSRRKPTGEPPLHALSDTQPAAPVDEPDERWEREWAQHHLRRAMERLPETFEARSVDLFRHLLEGDDVHATALQFDTTMDAVNKVKQRVRARLRAIVARQILDEEFPEHRRR